MTEGRDTTNLVDPAHALGAICAAIIDRFGAEAETMIRDLCARRGRALGEKLASTLSERSFQTGVEAFIAASSTSKTPAELVTLTSKLAVITGKRCPLSLQDKGLSVCRAMMAVDEGILAVACGREIRVTIEKSIANGDDCCIVVFEPV